MVLLWGAGAASGCRKRPAASAVSSGSKRSAAAPAQGSPSQVATPGSTLAPPHNVRHKPVSGSFDPRISQLW